MVNTKLLLILNKQPKHLPGHCKNRANALKKPEAMYTESAFRREELEGSGGEKQPEEGMESAEILRNICEKDVTLFRTAHSKDLKSVSWALRTLVEREPETFFRYL